jgi:hypothetical protein
MYILPQAKSSRHKSPVTKISHKAPPVSVKGVRLLHSVTSSAGPAAFQARKGIASGVERAYPGVRIIAFVPTKAFEACRT